MFKFFSRVLVRYMFHLIYSSLHIFFSAEEAKSKWDCLNELRTEMVAATTATNECIVILLGGELVCMYVFVCACEYRWVTFE